VRIDAIRRGGYPDLRQRRNETIFSSTGSASVFERVRAAHLSPSESSIQQDWALSDVGTRCGEVIDKTVAVTDDDAAQPDAEIPTERRFGWSNLFVAPDEDPRSQATSVGERATLIDFLTGCRQTLELKCRGLSAEQMARRSAPPSNMSLLGLIRHMADVERFWFRQVLSAEDAPRRYRMTEDRDADFNGASGDPAVVAAAWNAWREEMAFADQCIEGFDDLGTRVRLPDEEEDIAVREVLIHMVEEYARHCGHADLLRERIDGRVGA
jgi:uncharacterized damage-inducible protein DinB